MPEENTEESLQNVCRKSFVQYLNESKKNFLKHFYEKAFEDFFNKFMKKILGKFLDDSLEKFSKKPVEKPWNICFHWRNIWRNLWKQKSNISKICLNVCGVKNEKKKHKKLVKYPFCDEPAQLSCLHIILSV